MRVGLLSFRNAVNYGNVLQVYRQQTFLKKNDYDLIEGRDNIVQYIGCFYIEYGRTIA